MVGFCSIGWKSGIKKAPHNCPPMIRPLWSIGYKKVFELLKATLSTGIFRFHEENRLAGVLGP